MSAFTARFERLELKFLIEETIADRVRRQIAPYCAPDRHSGERTNGRGAPAGYAIDSLYLDSPGLAFHEAKERGDPDRLKLRIRTYSATSPGTLEVKRRRSNVIDKTRAAVGRERVEDAAGGRLDLSLCASPEARFLEDFSRIVATAGASPTLSVRYEREAFESVVDTYARVTFDRKISVRRTQDWTLNPDTDDWCAFDAYWAPGHLRPPVVMEVKCQSQVPAWVTDLVRQNDLIQTSFSKYSIGIELTNRMLGRRSHSRSAEALQ